MYACLGLSNESENCNRRLCPLLAPVGAGQHSTLTGENSWCNEILAWTNESFNRPEQINRNRLSRQRKVRLPVTQTKISLDPPFSSLSNIEHNFQPRLRFFSTRLMLWYFHSFDRDNWITRWNYRGCKSARRRASARRNRYFGRPSIDNYFRMRIFANCRQSDDPSVRLTGSWKFPFPRRSP